jgi:hypothetical protein
MAEQPQLAAKRRVAGSDEPSLQQRTGSLALGVAPQVDGTLLAVRSVVDLDGDVLPVHPLRERLERAQAVAEQEQRPHSMLLGGRDDVVGVQRA